MNALLAQRRLWYGVLGAPFAWIAQGLLGWYFGARICGEVSLGTVRATAGAIGIVALVVALASLSVSWKIWRTVREDDMVSPPDDAIAFLAFGGVFISATFAIGIFWAALNPLLLHGCGGTR